MANHFARKPIYFQDVNVRMLFTDVRPVHSNDEKNPVVLTPLLDDNNNVTQRRTLNTVAFVVLNDGFGRVQMSPTPELIGWIDDNMIVADDYYLEITETSDGDFLIIVKYNKILGSRWIKCLHPSELPSDWLNAIRNSSK